VPGFRRITLGGDKVFDSEPVLRRRTMLTILMLLRVGDLATMSQIWDN
jgi:hypothetical protein